MKNNTRQKKKKKKKLPDGKFRRHGGQWKKKM
jgi:hypothetical protein